MTQRFYYQESITNVKSKILDLALVKKFSETKISLKYSGFLKPKLDCNDLSRMDTSA